MEIVNISTLLGIEKGKFSNNWAPMNQKHEKSALGGFSPAARASPIAIMLYNLSGHYRIVSCPPHGTGGTRGGKS